MAAKEQSTKRKQAAAKSNGSSGTREKWRFLVFMATETESLIEAAKADLLELLTVKQTTGVSVHVHVHGFQVEPPQSQGSKCYTIEDGSLKHTCESPTPPSPAMFTTLANDLAASGFASTELEKFVRMHVGDLLVDSPPDIRVALVLWGHSQGVADAITGPPATSPFRVRPLIYAGASSTDIVARLRVALGYGRDGAAKVHPVDLLIFDSCFMGAAEVVAEFYEVANYLVASQSTVELPALQLASLVEAAKRTADPAMLGHETVSQASISSSGVRSLTLFQPRKAWLNPPCSQTAQPATQPGEPFLELALALHRGVRHAALAGRVFQAFHDAPFREVRQFLDLRRLTRLLARVNPNHSNDPRIGEAARKLHAALQPAPDGFIVEVCEREDRARFGGVSVYCPWFRASSAELRAGLGDAVVHVGDYLKLRLVSGCEQGELPPADSWGHLMFGLAHAWQLGRADGTADCTEECERHCHGCGRIPEGAAVGPDVRTGGPKDPKLGAADDDIA